MCPPRYLNIDAQKGRYEEAHLEVEGGNTQTQPRHLKETTNLSCAAYGQLGAAPLCPDP